MRTTVDIPDPMYRMLKSKAASEGSSVKQILLRGAEHELGLQTKKPGRRVKLPLVRSKNPGWLKIDNDKIAELLALP